MSRTKIRVKYDTPEKFWYSKESTIKENSVLCDHIRARGRVSSNPLIYALNDPRLISQRSHNEVPIDVSDPNALNRTRNTMQVSMLKNLESADYDVVQQRVEYLQRELNRVDERLKSTQNEIGAIVDDVAEQTKNHSALGISKPRNIAPALSTFNWSDSGTTNKETFVWRDVDKRTRAPYTNQWGSLSKYADDPCIIMLTMKNKEKFEASRRKKAR